MSTDLFDPSVDGFPNRHLYGRALQTRVSFAVYDFKRLYPHLWPPNTLVISPDLHDQLGSRTEVWPQIMMDCDPIVQDLTVVEDASGPDHVDVERRLQ